MNNNSIEPFEVKIWVWNGHPSSPTYILNEKELICYTSSQWDQINQKWVPQKTIFFEKKLTLSEKLISISKISIDEYEALPTSDNEIIACGGNEITIEFKKNNVVKKIHYYKSKYDNYTTQIIEFINAQLPEHTRIPTQKIN